MLSEVNFQAMYEAQQAQAQAQAGGVDQRLGRRAEHRSADARARRPCAR